MTRVLNLQAALGSLGPGLGPILAGIQKVGPGQVIRQCQWSRVSTNELAFHPLTPEPSLIPPTGSATGKS